MGNAKKLIALSIANIIAVIGALFLQLSMFQDNPLVWLTWPLGICLLLDLMLTLFGIDLFYMEKTCRVGCALLWVDIGLNVLMIGLTVGAIYAVSEMSAVQDVTVLLREYFRELTVPLIFMFLAVPVIIFQLRKGPLLKGILDTPIDQHSSKRSGSSLI